MKNKEVIYLIVILISLILIGVISSTSFAYFRDSKSTEIKELKIEYSIEN